MKLPSVLVLAAVLALTLVPGTARAEAVNPTVSALVTQLSQNTAQERQQAIKTAIAGNPSIATSLVAALISAYPADAAALTGFVVDAVLALGISNEKKAEMLTSVAQGATQAALAIPASSVTDLLATINAVKAALANVPTDLQQAVQAYIIPLSALPRDLFSETINNKPIVSSDTL